MCPLGAKTATDSNSTAKLHDSFFIGSFTTATPSLFFLCGRSSASQTQTHTHTHTDAQKQKHKHQWASACKLCSCWCCWGSCALLQCKHGSMTLGSHSTTRAAQAVSGSLRATTLIERVSTFPHPFPCAKEKSSHSHTHTHTHTHTRTQTHTHTDTNTHIHTRTPIACCKQLIAAGTLRVGHLAPPDLAQHRSMRTSTTATKCSASNALQTNVRS